MNPGVSRRLRSWSSSFFLICYFSSPPLSHSITTCLGLAHRQLQINVNTEAAPPHRCSSSFTPLQSINHGFMLASQKCTIISKFRRHLQGNNVKNNTFYCSIELIYAWQPISTSMRYITLIMIFLIKCVALLGPVLTYCYLFHQGVPIHQHNLISYRKRTFLYSEDVYAL